MFWLERLSTKMENISSMIKVSVAILTLSKEEHTVLQRQNTVNKFFWYFIYLKHQGLKYEERKNWDTDAYYRSHLKECSRKKFGVTQKTFCLVNPLEEFKCGQGLKPLPSRILR